MLILSSSRSTPRDPGEPPQRGKAVTLVTLTQRIYSGANTINGHSPHTTEIQAVLGVANALISPLRSLTLTSVEMMGGGGKGVYGTVEMIGEKAGRICTSYLLIRKTDVCVTVATAGLQIADGKWIMTKF